MKAFDRFSQRAIVYAQCRWDYADEAVDALAAECQLAADWQVADIGSGTGMVARHFVDRVKTVFAVEPNADMRNLASEALRAHRAYSSVNGHAASTTLPDRSVAMITVGRALHWFPPDATRSEFRRILQPSGWLAILSVPCTDASLLASMESVRVPENGWDLEADKRRMNPVPLSFYFGHDRFRTLKVAGMVNETWEAFLGRWSSVTPAPGPDHPRRPRFERALRDVFERHATGGILPVANATVIAFGRLCG
jgi:ubiquinone/menaquinone biosynthesis C-methylase UbiE